MTTAKKIETDLQLVAGAAIERTLSSLADIGFIEGAQVRSGPKTFEVKRISISLHSFRGYTLSVSLYGVQLRANGTFGEHVHYIGHPSNVTFV